MYLAIDLKSFYASVECAARGLDPLKTNLVVADAARTVILDVLRTTGITATAGIGTNLYLAKVAMDIGAKHVAPDESGVRIACLTERSYRETLWTHRPLTDFWRVGRGIAKKLEEKGLFTMGDIARCSLGRPDEFYNEELLYRMFGVNAELLIDHAWGCEPCTLADIKAYRPQTHSVSSGQVLQCPYPFEKARLVAREMADALALELARKGLVTDQMVLTVGYDRESLTDPSCPPYHGPVTVDHYGRRVPKAAHGSETLRAPTASSRELLQALTVLFDRIVDRGLLVRRMYVVANHVQRERDVQAEPEYVQLDLFADEAALTARREEQSARARERRMQDAVLAIREKYGKNAILKAMSLRDGATARQRNEQIGGHKA